MNQPILYWLNKLPAGYRERALRAYKNREHWRRSDANSMTRAVSLMTSWSRTVERDPFWRAVQYHYMHREYPEDFSYTPLPELPLTNKPRLRR